MHRLLRVLLLPTALSLGCSAPEHSTFSQAAPGPAFPAPALTPPGAGAPMVGQPSQEAAPEVPRSPHHRVLPPTSEPGLWAGDEPRASRAPQGQPELFGVALPGIPVSDKETDYGPAHLCVADWGHALPGTGLDDKVRSLRGQAKKCVVARMFNLCAVLMDGLDEASTSSGVVVLRSKQVRDKFRKSTKDFLQESCPQGLTPDQRRLTETLFAALVDLAHRTD